MAEVNDRTLDDLRDNAGDLSDDDLTALERDERAGAQEIATAERNRRADGDTPDASAGSDEAIETTGGEKAVRIGDDSGAVATPEENAELEHSQGGSTTRDDANDLGVPMLPGSPDEPQGPEDALGPGPKRGDYSQRVGPESYHPHESRMVDGVPTTEAQRPRTEDIGDEEGVKGGVGTT